ncbi:VenA family class IV lanthipeptide [Actinomadura bangladeshensis]|uniref:VenA family class IV lanthipeptide n=1 Tax=Actinomadura bangladeshensis TaxID=453573 RepID=UPI001405208C|nr:VenA family class IV lanthipeptide [Actinomadura bangladeshensis]
MDAFEGDLVAALQELPETDPIEIEGIQLGGTCACVGLLTLLNSVCVGISCI